MALFSLYFGFASSGVDNGRSCGRADLRRYPCGHSLSSPEKDLKHGSLAGNAGGGQFASVGFYDLAGDGQAKACALRLIGDKGPENIFQLKRRHTAAVIGNSYFYPLPEGRPPEAG